jgi:hypothetical protein
VPQFEIDESELLGGVSVDEVSKNISRILKTVVFADVGLEANVFLDLLKFNA